MRLPTIPSIDRPGPGYMPQLDALRAFAVAAVVIHHYVPDDQTALGDMGVKLFFVLSGFLITGILIRSRNKAERTGESMMRVIKNFYIRRSLRIFPLYYLVVFIAVVFAIPPVFKYLPYLMTYTLNLKIAWQGHFIKLFAHFWTLSVEEQYYLAWAWIVLFIPRTRLLPAVVAMTLMGFGYRVFLLIGWNYFDLETPGLASYVFTLSAFDTLGMGSLLAVLRQSDLGDVKLNRLVDWAGVIGSAGLVATIIGDWELDLWDSFVIYDLLLAFTFVWVIHRASRGFGGPTGWMLSLAPLRYVGRISYGIYVYHPLTRPLLASALASLGIGFEPHTPIGFASSLLAVLLVATVSWYAFENPINRLKGRFSG